MDAVSLKVVRMRDYAFDNTRMCICTSRTDSRLALRRVTKLIMAQRTDEETLKLKEKWSEEEIPLFSAAVCELYVL